MKNSLTILLIFSFACSFFLANAQDNGWEFGIKANTFNTNIPDPYKTNEGGAGISFRKSDILASNYNDRSFSLGVLIKKKIKFSSLNLRIDYNKTNLTTMENPTPEGANALLLNSFSLNENVITVSPQIEFSCEFAKIKLVYGFELPITFYGNDKFSVTTETIESNQLVYADYQTGTLGYGTSVGAGLFAGFYYKLNSKISLGGILFSSIDYYSNKQKSNEEDRAISQFNPVIEQDTYEEDPQNIKAVVFEPVNISFVILYKIK